MERQSKDDEQKRRVIARCHGLENMGWIIDRKMRCSFCGVIKLCMWGPLDEYRYPSLHESDTYGAICFKCCALDRPPQYDYISRLWRRIALVARAAEASITYPITDRVAEYSFEACTLYARWLEIYSWDYYFQLTPERQLFREAQWKLVMKETPSRQEAVKGALELAEASTAPQMPVHEAFLARTSTPVLQRLAASVATAATTIRISPNHSQPLAAHAIDNSTCHPQHSQPLAAHAIGYDED